MKYNTVITDKNGGNHAPHQTKACWEWIDQCVADYKSPRLYHIAIANDVSSEGWAGYLMHKSILKDVMQRLRRKYGIRCSFKAAREDDTDRNPEGKGQHIHAFILCESRFADPYKVLNKEVDGWLERYVSKRKCRAWINEPRNEMHHELGRKYNYMALPPSKPERIADAKQWVTYLHKMRDKPTSGEIYTSSRGIPTTKTKGKASRLEATF